MCAMGNVVMALRNVRMQNRCFYTDEDDEWIDLRALIILFYFMCSLSLGLGCVVVGIPLCVGF